MAKGVLLHEALRRLELQKLMGTPKLQSVFFLHHKDLYINYKFLNVSALEAPIYCL